MQPPSRRIRRTHRRILEDLSVIADAAARTEDLGRRAEAVSAWSIGEQLEHLARTDQMVLDGLDRLDEQPESEPGGPTLLGRILLATGYIPRGKGRAPGAVKPQGMEPEELRRALAETARRFAALESRLPEIEASTSTVAHPALGRFTPDQWLRFLHIHHHHHLKIIHDIRRAG